MVMMKKNKVGQSKDRPKGAEGRRSAANEQRRMGKTVSNPRARRASEDDAERGSVRKAGKMTAKGRAESSGESPTMAGHINRRHRAGMSGPRKSPSHAERESRGGGHAAR